MQAYFVNQVTVLLSHKHVVDLVRAENDCQSTSLISILSELQGGIKSLISEVINCYWMVVQV